MSSSTRLGVLRSRVSVTGFLLTVRAWRTGSRGGWRATGPLARSDVAVTVRRLAGRHTGGSGAPDPMPPDIGRLAARLPGAPGPAGVGLPRRRGTRSQVMGSPVIGSWRCLGSSSYRVAGLSGPGGRVAGLSGAGCRVAGLSGRRFVGPGVPGRRVIGAPGYQVIGAPGFTELLPGHRITGRQFTAAPVPRSNHRGRGRTIGGRPIRAVPGRGGPRAHGPSDPSHRDPAGPAGGAGGPGCAGGAGARL
jgi:hypothetical protein